MESTWYSTDVQMQTLIGISTIHTRTQTEFYRWIKFCINRCDQLAAKKDQMKQSDYDPRLKDITNLSFGLMFRFDPDFCYFAEICDYVKQLVKISALYFSDSVSQSFCNFF